MIYTVNISDSPNTRLSEKVVGFFESGEWVSIGATVGYNQVSQGPLAIALMKKFDVQQETPADMKSLTYILNGIKATLILEGQLALDKDQYPRPVGVVLSSDDKREVDRLANKIRNDFLLVL